MAIIINFEVLTAQIDKQNGLSRWFTISQAQINMFADAIHDSPFIHVDTKG